MVLNHHPHSHVVTHDRPKAASHPQWPLCPSLSRSARPPWRPLLPLPSTTPLSPPSHLSPPSAHPMAALHHTSQPFPPPAWPAAAGSRSRLPLPSLLPHRVYPELLRDLMPRWAPGTSSVGAPITPVGGGYTHREISKRCQRTPGCEAEVTLLNSKTKLNSKFSFVERPP